MSYKCLFGNYLHGSDDWNPGNESTQSVERKLFRAIPRGIYACISGRRRNSQREPVIGRGVEQKKVEQKFLGFFQSQGCVQFFATLWIAARQASLSFIVSQNLLKLMSIESVMPSNHLILCHPFSSCKFFTTIEIQETL